MGLSEQRRSSWMRQMIHGGIGSTGKMVWLKRQFLFKRVVIATLVMLISAALAACKQDDAPYVIDEEALANVNETGMPIVKEPITLKFFIGKRADNLADLDHVSGLNLYEEMTNIDIQWDQVMADAIEERRNLAIAGENLPDVFYGAGFSNIDIFEYAQQGIFIELTELIEQYAPNLSRLLKENPEIKQAMTFPDGGIYAMPYIWDPDFVEVFVDPILWINEEWLEALDMSMPETTDEFYEFLKAVKEKDPNGNGLADEIPYGGHNIDVLLRWLSGSFNTQNKGNPYIEQDPDDPNKVRFVPITEEYKQMLEYVHKLYSEKLIEQTIFSIETNRYLATGQSGLYASTVYYVPNEVFFTNQKQPFIPGVPLKGPNGDASLLLGHPLANIGQMLITKANPNPVATVRWADYFYSDEGSRLVFMGVEGLSYEKTEDGTYENTELITNNPDGLAPAEAIAQHALYRSVNGVAGLLKQAYFAGEEGSPEATARAKKLEPYFKEERGWPQFTYTVEENRRLSALADDIQTYVDEMKIRFIAGETPFSEWDRYVKTIQNMGLEEYMKIQQAAYERYMSVK